MFIVIELQKNGDQVSNLVTTHATSQEAESKFHTILGFAAVSNVEVHSAVLIDDKGQFYRSESYDHTTPAPETEETPVEE